MRQRIFAVLLLVLFAINGAGALAQTPVPAVSSPSVVLLDAKSGQVLAEKSAREKRPMASTTKMMTAIVVLKRKSLQDTAIVSPEAANAGGSELALNPGEQRTIEELLYGLMLRSANDAGIVLAEAAGESTSNFANLMNEEAKSIGARQTNFVNPHGLYDPNHFSTAYDLALIARHGLKNPVFARLVSTKEQPISWPGSPNPVILRNRNKLLWQYPDANGVKTGHVNESGYCLVGAAKKNGVQLITVVLGAPTSKVTYEDTIKLLEYGFNNFKPQKVVEKGRVYQRVELPIVSRKKLALKAARDLILLQGGELKAQKKVKVRSNLSLPILKNQKLGQIVVTQGDKKLAKIDLVASQHVPKPTLAQRFLIFLKTVFLDSHAG